MKQKAITLKDFIVFDSLKIGPVRLEARRLKVPYTLTVHGGRPLSYELIYSYGEKVFEPKDTRDLNLASVIGAQVAINYGLFCKQLIFDGILDETDRRFILDAVENTSREILVNKLLGPNEFLTSDFKGLLPQQQPKYTAARVIFQNTSFPGTVPEWSFSDTNTDSYLVLSSGGKDSLLSYGLVKEMGFETHPVFVNESGRHWFTAINAHRYLEGVEPNTARVWCNSDRVFNWILRQMPFIRPNFADIRADIYPIRLWTLSVFLFGVLPIARKRKIGNVLIGNEYDTTVRKSYQGITHYDGLYDQSKHFDNALTRYYLKKGWRILQYSLLRSLSELLILKVLVERYPNLQEQQVSCHAAHKKNGRMHPCGNCEKCRRIVGMLVALGEDPRRCGFERAQIERALGQLKKKKVKQIGPDASHLYYLLVEGGKISKNHHTSQLARRNNHIMKLRFDLDRSNLRDMPHGIRLPVFSILQQHAGGIAVYQNRKWVDSDLHVHLQKSYIFDIYANNMEHLETQEPAPSFFWEKMSWKDIGKRLETVDTAILPCGAIEQHGPHLPVDIDYYDAVHLAHKVADACSEPKPFVLPPIPFGVSYHHEDFKGTISVTNDALSRFVYDIGMSLAKNGIKKMIILNGHGDNAPTLAYAAQMINRDAEIFVCVDTGETSDIDLYGLIETPNDIHAGEIETSTTLALRPELVKMDEAINETPAFGSEYLNYTSDRSVAWYVRTKRISESGIMGDPTKATAEKGRKMWEIMISHLVKFVEEIKKSRLEELYQKRY